MSITVVGSIAYDAVKTPFGKRERMLGGAATHFSLAASLFETVRPVGPVGGDFADSEFETLRTRGTITDDVEVVPDGRTFFWSGRYGWDLNSRDTLDTQLGVFGEFQPRLSEPARDCDVLFLANIQPALQLSVLDQCHKSRWVGLDSMNFWIDSARTELVDVIERVDCVVLNDDEFRQLTGKPSLPAAAREILAMGPSSMIAKQGKYGAVLFTKDGFFALPAYPVEKVVDPTGAGDAFAGGLAGYIASQRGRAVDHGLLATAMAYGTSVASYNVEEFGTERVTRLTLDEVKTRVNDLHRMTQFTHSSVEETIA
jgi:sugar/nucleoside kinase (ribokinase family)